MALQTLEVEAGPVAVIEVDHDTEGCDQLPVGLVVEGAGERLVEAQEPIGGVQAIR